MSVITGFDYCVHGGDKLNSFYYTPKYHQNHFVSDIWTITTVIGRCCSEMILIMHQFSDQDQYDSQTKNNLSFFCSNSNDWQVLLLAMYYEYYRQTLTAWPRYYCLADTYVELLLLYLKNCMIIIRTGGGYFRLLFPYIYFIRRFDGWFLMNKMQ